MKTKNNRRYLQSILGAILAVSAGLVLSCEQLDGSFPAAPAGKGSVVLTVSAGSPPGSTVRTILPTETPTFSSYELVFTKGQTSLDPVPVTPAELESGYQQELEAGEWTVEVTASRKFWDDPAAAEYKAAKGRSDPFTVAAGTVPESVEVTIQPIPIGSEGSEDGLFTYEITFPADSGGILTLIPPDAEDEDDYISIPFGNDTENVFGELPPAAADDGTWTVGASMELDPGYYGLSILLRNGDGSIAGSLEVVHIYAGLESVGEFEFTADDFTRTVYLTGKIPTLEGVDPDYDSDSTDINVYTDPEYQSAPLNVDMHTYEIGENSYWRLDVPAADALNRILYIKSTLADVSGIVYTYTADTGKEPLTEAGKRDIDFAYASVDIPDGKLPVSALSAALALAAEADEEVTLNDVTLETTKEYEELQVKHTTVNLTGTLTVPANVKFAVDEAGTFNVAEGATVDVSGYFIVTGDSGGGDLKGTINVLPGGTSLDKKSGGGSLWKDAGSTGKYQFNSGAQAIVWDSDLEQDLLIIGGGNDDAAIKLEPDAVFTNWQTAYTLNGDATIAQPYGIDSKAVTIEKGTLTVAAGLTLYNGTTLNGIDGATIILKDEKTITGAGNFYDGEGKPVQSPITAQGDEAYAWQAGASGTGWFKEGTVKYAIWIAPTTNGAVISDKTSAEAGETVTLTVEPAAKYELVTLKANDTDVTLTDGEYTFTMPMDSVTVTAEFARITYAVNGYTDANDNSVTADKASAAEDDPVTLTVTAQPGYEFKPDSLKVTYGTDGEIAPSPTGDGTYTFTMPAFEVTVEAEFDAIVYTITIDDSIANGTVETDKQDATIGETVTLTVTPSDGYRLKAGTLKANDTVVELTSGTYTFSMPADDVTVTAQFETKPIAAITVTFEALKDEEIDLGETEDTLSWWANDELEVTVDSSFSVTKWVLDEVALDETTNTLTISAGTLEVKKHTLTVFVTKNNVTYTKRLAFTVVK